MAKKLTYTIPAVDLETKHVHVEFHLVVNPEGKLSAVGQLFNHELNQIARIDFPEAEVESFKTFTASLMKRLCDKAGIKEVE